jgi:hypothetical protein
MPDSLNTNMSKFYQALVEGNLSLLGALSVTRAAVGNEATTSNTSGATSSVNAPGADATIASIVALAAGTYDVECTTFIAGTTVAATESDNMAFKIGSTVIGKIITPVPGTTGANGLGEYRIRINLPAPTTVSVNSVGAATAGSVYKASIVASKIGY